MCHDLDSHPPLTPIAGAAVDGESLLLTSDDGTRLRAYAARPATAGGPGIVILPDVRGLHPFYEELALRFAEAGVHAVAIDYFARTAGSDPRPPETDVAPHLAQLRQPSLEADVAAGVAHLRGAGGGGADRVYTVGFCFGGRLSWLQAAARHGLAGVIGFYGVPSGPGRAGLAEPAAEAGRFTCPVLALFGEADEGIPEMARAAFEEALRDAGVEHRIRVYPGAPHSFFDRKATDFADAAADAWREVLAFVGAPAAG